MNRLLEQVIAIARKAGGAVMQIYDSGELGVELKSDNTPLTLADKAAHEVIEAELKCISDYPVISEEGSHIADNRSKFWLVDPIDGTKDFVMRNGEFTVNIALVEDGRPVLGVVYAPAKDIMYFAAEGQGAFKQQGGGQPAKISADFRGQTPVVVASRNHMNQETEDFLQKLGSHRTVNMGSSLKLCLVAEGKAAVYPRFTPTSLWDTAAAHAVVSQAGGSVTDFSGRELTYNPQKEILNPYFIVTAKNKSYLNLL